MKTIAERIVGLETQRGFVGLHYDRDEGKLFLELTGVGEELLYRCNLATGLGTTEVMLDRGQMEGFQLCRFERVGNRVLLIQRNLGYRFGIDEPSGRRSVDESFANRIVSSLPLEAEEEGRLLVDATSWLRGDSLQLPRRLTEHKLGKFRIDTDRCAFHLPRTKAFADNTEVEVYVTLQAEEPVPEKLQRYLPDRSTATLRQRHSFRRLPEPGYFPRELDPRVGYFSVDFNDYARKPTEALDRRLICRWRLEKVDPAATLSRPIRPIRFHLDRGIPEPIRSAIREGALWWNDAFRAAGFEGALEVVDLPEDADPLDCRISTILWVHRAERGWSVGWTAVDPRTGEILESNVLLDSHRVRTCHEMWLALAGSGENAGTTEEEFILRRIRLLSAHEVGHALGLAHNFASAAYGRGSVMDYYAPRVGIQDGRLDLGDAYLRSLGPYDVWAIRHGYAVGDGDDLRARLDGIVRDGLRQGLHLLADHEAQDLGGPDPRAHQYIDGSDPVDELNRIREVRRKGLAAFGMRNLVEGERLGALQKRFAFIYLLHRFALQAAAKAVGGVYLSYAHKGDGQAAFKPVEAERQTGALTAILQCLEPEELAVPAGALEVLAPEPLFYSSSPDALASVSHPTFDPLEPARQLAKGILSWLLEEKRCTRLASPGARSPLDLGVVLSKVSVRLFQPELPEDPTLRALRRVGQRALVERLEQLAESRTAVGEVKDAASGELRRIQSLIRDDVLADSGSDHLFGLQDELDRFFRRDYRPEDKKTEIGLPPGFPIGCGSPTPGATGPELLLDGAGDWL